MRRWHLCLSCFRFRGRWGLEGQGKRIRPEGARKEGAGAPRILPTSTRGKISSGGLSNLLASQI